MALVNYRTGRAYTRREQKNAVLSATGMTSQEYDKAYRVFFNRAKNYQTYTGIELQQPVVDLFAQLQLGRARYGASYNPTPQTAQILATSSETTTAGVTRAKRARAREIQQQQGGRALTPAQKAQVDFEATVSPVAPTGAGLALLNASFPRLRGLLQNYSSLRRELEEVYGVKVDNNGNLINAGELRGLTPAEARRILDTITSYGRGRKGFQRAYD